MHWDRDKQIRRCINKYVLFPKSFIIGLRTYPSIAQTGALGHSELQKIDDTEYKGLSLLVNPCNDPERLTRKRIKFDLDVLRNNIDEGLRKGFHLYGIAGTRSGNFKRVPSMFGKYEGSSHLRYRGTTTTIVLQIESEEQCADIIYVGSGAGIATGGQGRMRNQEPSRREVAMKLGHQDRLRKIFERHKQKAKMPRRQVPLCAGKAIVQIRGRTITGGNGGRQSLLPYHERLGIASLSTSSEHGESSRFRDETVIDNETKDTNYRNRRRDWVNGY
ncbi:hypothetical protein ARMGADRAFT_1032052 [Armillaria gallica]|uniref:Uncharacterized protein n=1 Tax=Armillaria gallica TaxID=47427 RepID=A0A2H3DPF8_ARMGA|nr:hypothetical protein ARMGADRAFT_1032052 [Armillaria gallica]